MTYFKENKKRLLSAVIALVMMINLAFMSIVSIAAQGSDQEVKVQPTWFTEENKTNWWIVGGMYEEGHGRCDLTVQDGVWKYLLKTDWGWTDNVIEYNQGELNIDTSKTPYLNIKVKASKDTTLFLNKKPEGDWIRLDFATIKANQLTEMQIKLSDIPGIEQLIDDQGILSLTATGFKTDNFVPNTGDYLEYYDFYFTSAKKNVVEYTPGWVIDDYTAWWATDQADSIADSWRFTMQNAWTYTVHGLAWDQGFCESNSSGLYIDTNKAPYLYYKVKTPKESNIYINVSKEQPADGQKPADLTKIKLADIPNTSATEGYIKISDIPGISDFMQNGQFYLHGMGFSTEGFEVEDSFAIYDFYAADFNVSIENDKTVYTEVADSRIQPDWFNADKRSVWFSVDQADASGTSWRFTVKEKQGMSYTLNGTAWDQGFVNTNQRGFNVNVNETPYLTIKVTSPRYSQLFLNVKQKDDQGELKQLKFTTVSGEKEVQFKLADIPGLSDYIDADGNFFLHGIGFTTTGFAVGDKFTYHKFLLTSEFDPALKLPETLTPVWFNEDKTTSWDASGQYSGTENEKCSIEVQGGKWKYILKSKSDGDNNYVESNTDSIQIDTTLMPYLNIKVESSADSDFYIVTGNGEKITVGTVKSGYTKEIQLKLTETEGIADAIDSDGILQLNGAGFYTDHFSVGDSLRFHHFYATEEEMNIPTETDSAIGDDTIYPVWLSDSEAGDWWDWDWSTGSGTLPTRFSVKFQEDGTVDLEFHGDFEDYKHLGAKYTLDLAKTPYLYYDINSEFATDLRLVLGQGADYNDGVKIINTINGESKGIVDLREVDSLKSFIYDNKLDVYGMVFRNAYGTQTNGKKMSIRLFDFAGYGKQYPSERPEAPVISLDDLTMTEQVNVSVNAPSGAQRVMYKIGANGDYTDYTAPIMIKKNVPIYAKYFSANGFWSLESKLQITNIVSGSGGDAETLQPNWFDKANKDYWWSDDWHVDQDDANRFSLSYDNDLWKLTVGQEWAKNVYVDVWEPDSCLTVNLNEQNAVFYKANSEFNVKVYLNIKKSVNDKEEPTKVYIGEIPAGKSSDYFLIGQNSNLLALSDDNNDLFVQGVRFEYEAAVGSTMLVERFLFDDENEYYEGYPDSVVTVIPMTPDWFSVVNVDKWWNGTVQNGTADAAGKFEVKINDDNDFQADLASNTAIESKATPITIQMVKNNTLYYRIRNSADLTVSLMAKTSAGMKKVVVLNQLKAGQNSGFVNLKELFPSIGKVELTGVVFESAVANTVFVDSFIFDKPDQIYIGYPDEEQEKENQEKAAAVDEAIMAIGEVTLSNKQAVLDARAKYNALTDLQKSYVRHFDVLVNAEAQLDDLLLSDTSEIMNKIPEDKIIAYINDNPNKKVIINLNAGDIISPTVLKAAKTNNCDIVVKLIDPQNDTIKYMITITSENILDPTIPFDTALLLQEDEVEKFAGKQVLDSFKDSFKSGTTGYFALNQEKLGVKAGISLSLNSDPLKAQTSQSKFYIYRFDKVENKIYLVAESVTANNGMVSFDVSNAGIYAISTLKLNNVPADINAVVQTGVYNDNIFIWTLILLLGFSGVVLFTRKRFLIK